MLNTNFNFTVALYLLKYCPMLYISNSNMELILFSDFRVFLKQDF